MPDKQLPFSTQQEFDISLQIKVSLQEKKICSNVCRIGYTKLAVCIPMDARHVTLHTHLLNKEVWLIVYYTCEYTV